MANFENGEKVSWVEEMVCVPHPDGKTDRKGNVLPVFRDKTTTGTVINSLYDNKYTVMPFPNLTRYLDDGLVDCNLFDWR